MTRILYAAYGSNLHPVRLNERVPSAKHAGIAVLPGFSLRFHKRSKDNSAKCNIVKAEDQVFVSVFEFDQADRNALDKAEGLGFGYEEAWLEIPGHGTCYTYLAEESHVDESLQPFSWYKSLVLLGCQYNEFPDDYIKRIRAVPELQDPDSERHHQNMKLVERIANGA